MKILNSDPAVTQQIIFCRVRNNAQAVGFCSANFASDPASQQNCHILYIKKLFLALKTKNFYSSDLPFLLGRWVRREKRALKPHFMGFFTDPANYFLPGQCWVIRVKSVFFGVFGLKSVFFWFLGLAKSAFFVRQVVKNAKNCKGK